MYASNISLDMHLKDASLTWTKRLKIAIDVAVGLDFLHGGVVTQDMVIHRDIKSSNILLTADWKAKITDFGLSIIIPINTEIDFVVDNACDFVVDFGLCTGDQDF
ncbi:protein kinase-like domain, Phloem protein 2-like protein [Artemisia annua]|uniref:Protein kinase-like domain, Phloem protein 2-like protein n=1 Tax=Artemisia annua TaxID=35608 RepID=A0A2U1PTX9_ARTAN|nr:protein kinase-like domain, Phloem protein 2-like protein [Artemisia annua]